MPEAFESESPSRAIPTLENNASIGHSAQNREHRRLACERCVLALVKSVPKQASPPFFLINRKVRLVPRVSSNHISRITAGPRWLALVLGALLLAACATTPLPEESEPVVGLMAERLRLAQEVAWVKWQNGLPVRDPARESAVLEKLTRQGERAGIDEVLVVRFVKAQIEASCLEQEAWMTKWRKGEPLPEGDPPSLESLRIRLDRISTFLLAEWAAAPTTPRAAAKQTLLKSVSNPRSAAVAASGFVDSDF